MAGRILTLQRQARELGRLRAGLTETTVKNGREVTYPTSSKTWILTSSQREYLDVAATAWGGTVAEWEPQGGGPKAWRLITEAEAIDAILPPGDPLSQSFELWSKGGCQRRCDGEQEARSGEPCLCRAQFGDNFHEQKQGTVCDIHTRLTVILPDLPDIGVWRVETKGYWAANRIAACVDLIKAQVGPQILVPVRLWIEPKKKTANGKTSQYTEIVLGVRGGITFGQVLAGQLPNLAVEAGTERAAIGAGPATEAGAEPQREELTAERVIALASLVKNVEQLQQLWRDAVADGVLTDAVKTVLNGRAAELKNDAKSPAQRPTPEPGSAVETLALDAEVEPDVETTWSALLNVAGKRGWSSDDLEARIDDLFGVSGSEINGWQMATLLDEIRKGRVE